MENVHHMRLMTLLQELVRERGYRGAARVLELDRRTVTTCATTGRLSRRARHALERALQEGAGSAAAQQRERNDDLDERVEALEKGHEALEKGQDELGKELRKRMAAVEGRIKAVPRSDAQGTGAGHDRRRSLPGAFRPVGERCVGQGQETRVEAQDETGVPRPRDA